VKNSSVTWSWRGGGGEMLMVVVDGGAHGTEIKWSSGWSKWFKFCRSLKVGWWKCEYSFGTAEQYPERYDEVSGSCLWYVGVAIDKMDKIMVRQVDEDWFSPKRGVVMKLEDSKGCPEVCGL